MKLRRLLFVIVALGVSVAMTGCGASNMVKDTAIGAGAGALLGGIIGHAAGNTAAGAIIGGAVGGTAGAVIGHNMDKQAEEMQKNLDNAKVERVGESGINITLDSGILFAVGSDKLQASAKKAIEKLANILVKYPDTNILVEGDTDNTGSREGNQKLSERRAKAVADYAISLGVASSRITTVGKGDTNPVAPNTTVEGRAKNRRVEIGVVANEKMKEDAKAGNLN